MGDPTEAAHALGKLLKHVGPNRVLWGTDSIWYGSPQDQIQAFRAFQISREFQDRYGYPALTADAEGGHLRAERRPDLRRRSGPGAAPRRGGSGRAPSGRLPRRSPAELRDAYGPRDGFEWRRFLAVHGVGPG